MRAIAILVLSLLFGAAAYAAETISYTYNARGELVSVSHSGTVNNGVATTYSHDRARNRVTKTTTGSP